MNDMSSKLDHYGYIFLMSSKLDHYSIKMVMSMVIRFRHPYRQKFDGFVNCSKAGFVPCNNFPLTRGHDF